MEFHHDVHALAHRLAIHQHLAGGGHRNHDLARLGLAALGVVALGVVAARRLDDRAVYPAEAIALLPGRATPIPVR